MIENEFREELRTQIIRLDDAARRFDDGGSHAVRDIAVVLRVLLHDTRSSTSLLQHLNAKHIRLLSTAPPGTDADALFAEGGVIVFDRNWNMRPAFGTSRHRRFVEVEEWLEEAVQASRQHGTTNRRFAILEVANKEGGAHVDPNRKSAHESLIEGQMTIVGGGRPPSTSANQHHVYLRQFAYELLHSPEILSLVSPTYTLPSDAEVEDEKRIREGHDLDAADRLVERVQDCVNEGDFASASRRAENVMRMIASYESQRAYLTRGYLIRFLVHHKPGTDAAHRIALLEPHVSRIDARFHGKVLGQSFLYQTIQNVLDLAVAYEAQGESTASGHYYSMLFGQISDLLPKCRVTTEQYWNLCLIMAKSKFQLAALCLRSKDLDSALRHYDQLAGVLESLNHGWYSSSSFQELREHLSDDNATVLLRLLAGYQFNRAELTIQLARRNDGHSIFEDLLRRFQSIDDPEIRSLVVRARQQLASAN